MPLLVALSVFRKSVPGGRVDRMNGLFLLLVRERHFENEFVQLYVQLYRKVVYHVNPKSRSSEASPQVI